MSYGEGPYVLSEFSGDGEYVLRFQPADPAFGLHSLRVRVARYPDAIIQTRRSDWAGIFEARP